MADRQTYDGNGNLLFVETIPDVPVVLLPVDIVALFTPSELLALETSTSLVVVAFRTQFFAAINPIGLDDPRFLAAVQTMESLGILTAARANAVRSNTRPT